MDEGRPEGRITRVSSGASALCASPPRVDNSLDVQTCLSVLCTRFALSGPCPLSWKQDSEPSGAKVLEAVFNSGMTAYTLFATIPVQFLK
jgi:hypothetical protein